MAPINLATCAVVDLFYDWLLDGHINHIGLCIWGRVLLPPLHASVCLPFIHITPSKNEAPPVPIHIKIITQHRIRPVYQPSQQSTHISRILELYVRQVRNWKFLS